MTRLRSQFTFAACCLLVAGCSQAGGTSRSGYVPSPDSLTLHPSTGGFTLIHSFSGGDGNGPVAGLAQDKGTGDLYGTTQNGGGSCGCGVVFGMTLGGSLTMLLPLSSGLGVGPVAPVLDVGGTLYATAQYGGAYGPGTVFSVTTGGSPKLIYNFGGGSSGGAHPVARVIDVGGKLYGTTSTSYPSGFGTVFSTTTGGKEKVLYTFHGGSSGDGDTPLAPLLDVGGTLYGTTYYGGGFGAGTVFSVTTAGNEKVLHAFGAGPDGVNPRGGLVNLGGALFGTTFAGGKHGHGTVFVITTGGVENVVHSFDVFDGAEPQAALLSYGGKLYGTTYAGGSANDGTVFSLTTGGFLKVLHNFTGPDGKNPAGHLIVVDGVLYGTTQSGGAFGKGTVFSLVP